MAETFGSLFARDMTGEFNTPLSDEEEAAFAQWVMENNRMRDLYNYDLRGAWKELNSGSMSADARGHLGDKYKKPNHPTFSVESVYAKHFPERAVEWGVGAQGTNIYSAQGMSPDEFRYLQRYFQAVEPNSILEVRH